MKAGKGIRTFSGWRRIKRGMVFLLALLLGSSCGNGTGQEDRDITSENSGENRTEENSVLSPDSEDNTNEMIAVADFYYLPLSSLRKDFALSSEYTISDQWMYYTREVSGTGEKWSSDYIHIDRSRISDGYEEQDYYVSEKDTAEVRLHLLLADKEGNCYGFWGPGHYVLNMQEDAPKIYFLEKYDGGGEVLWHKEFSGEELQDMGESLEQGTVTEDGRVFLYTCGKDGKVFSFRESGDLEEIYIPKLKSLDGVVEGKGGKVYGYRIIESGEARFQELGGSGESRKCPVLPLGIWDGHGSDICLYDGEGMWNYDPGTEEAKLLWRWNDEYVQIDNADVGRIFREGDRFTVMCFEQKKDYDMDVRPVQTFAFIRPEESRNFPDRQVVTLATTADPGVWKNWRLDYLVKRYNRQSRKYRVEIAAEADQTALEMKFLKGEAADVIDLTNVYAGDLARAGAFEDLTEYYNSGTTVNSESILDSVKAACFLGNRNVLVMPGFIIETLRTVGEIEVEDWDVWEFLELGQDHQMFRTQSPGEALMYCMGVRRGEGFVDYENNESHFDSPEFRRILEECARWQTYEEKGGVGPSVSATIVDGNLVVEGGIAGGNEEKDWLFDNMHINHAWYVTDNMDEEYAARLVGYPGRTGAEYKLSPNSIFAMNSASKCKEGAWDFLEFILSPKMQDQIDWCLPVRKDSFEKCITNLYVSPIRTRVMPFVDTETGERMENLFRKSLTEEEIAALHRMVDLGVYDSWGGKSNPLWAIVAEEAEMYFQGDAALDDTAAKIQNRVQLYLDERN